MHMQEAYIESIFGAMVLYIFHEEKAFSFDVCLNSSNRFPNFLRFGHWYSVELLQIKSKLLPRPPLFHPQISTGASSTSRTKFE